MQIAHSQNKVDNLMKYRLLSTSIIFGAFFLIPAELPAQWTQTSGIFGGSVQALAISGTNLCAATPHGVFLSTDSGTNWVPSNSGLTNNVTHQIDNIVKSFAVSGTKLFAATGLGSIFISTNDGASWSVYNGDFYGTPFSILAVSDTNLYVGSYMSVICYSTISGVHWSWYDGLPGSPVSGLAAIPDGIGGTSVFAAISGCGVFLLTNSSHTWVAANAGLTNNFVSALISYPNGTGGLNLLAGTRTGIFLSTNNGTNWTIPDTQITRRIVQCIVANGGNIFAGTDSGVFRSTDHGFSWKCVGAAITNQDVRSIAASGNHIMIGTNAEGVCQSVDNGSNWTLINNGMKDIELQSIATFKGSLFAGTRYGTVYISTNNGTSWNSNCAGPRIFNRLLGGSYVNAFAFNDSVLCAGTNDGPMTSIDDGASWTLFSLGGPIYSLATIGANIVAGSIGAIYLSADNGASWSGKAESNISYVNALTVVKDSVGVPKLLAGDSRGGIFASTNLGANWNSTTTGLTNSNIRCFASMGANLFAGTSMGVSLSTDNGSSWTSVNSGLTSTSVRCMVTSDQNLFVGTSGGGIFASTNDGTSWNSVNTGMSNMTVRSLAINGTYLYAVTDSCIGVWKRPLSEIITSVAKSSTNLPAHFRLDQNYPNPFNPTTTITFSLSAKSFVSLRVFDLMGREVATVVSEELSAGTHSRQWNATTMSSGVYVYRLQAGASVESKKSILLR